MMMMKDTNESAFFIDRNNNLSPTKNAPPCLPKLLRLPLLGGAKEPARLFLLKPDQKTVKPKRDFKLLKLTMPKKEQFLINPAKKNTSANMTAFKLIQGPVKSAQKAVLVGIEIGVQCDENKAEKEIEPFREVFSPEEGKEPVEQPKAYNSPEKLLVVEDFLMQDNEAHLLNFVSVASNNNNSLLRQANSYRKLCRHIQPDDGNTTEEKRTLPQTQFTTMSGRKTEKGVQSDRTIEEGTAANRTDFEADYNLRRMREHMRVQNAFHERGVEVSKTIYDSLDNFQERLNKIQDSAMNLYNTLLGGEEKGKGAVTPSNPSKRTSSPPESPLKASTPRSDGLAPQKQLQQSSTPTAAAPDLATPESSAHHGEPESEDTLREDPSPPGVVTPMDSKHGNEISRKTSAQSPEQAAPMPVKATKNREMSPDARLLARIQQRANNQRKRMAEAAKLAEEMLLGNGNSSPRETLSSRGKPPVNKSSKLVVERPSRSFSPKNAKADRESVEDILNRIAKGKKENDVKPKGPTTLTKPSDDADTSLPSEWSLSANIQRILYEDDKTDLNSSISSCDLNSAPSSSYIDWDQIDRLVS